MFKQQNLPYIFTIVIATLGWLLTRAVDEMTRSPMVAYRIHDTVDAQGGRLFSVRLHNITGATAFRDIYLILTNLDGVRSRFTGADFQYEAPAHVSKQRKTTAEWENTWAGVQVTELQPKTAVRLVAQIKGPDVPVIRYDSATNTVRLVEEGWQTYAVENEARLLLGLAIGLTALLLFYVVYLAKNRTSVGTAAAAVAAFLAASGFCSAGTIRVVDTDTGRGVPCELYHEDGNAKRVCVGKKANGVFQVGERGKSGEKYVALSEVYNPASADCPLGDVIIRVRRTTLLRDHVAKAEFLASAGAPAAAALEFRKAALIAEKNQDIALFNQLEYRVAEVAARALGVEQPFVETADGVRSSMALRSTVQEYQRERDLKATGALSSTTLHELAATTPAGRSSYGAESQTTRATLQSKEL